MYATHPRVAVGAFHGVRTHRALIVTPSLLHPLKGVLTLMRVQEDRWQVEGRSARRALQRAPMGPGSFDSTSFYGNARLLEAPQGQPGTEGLLQLLKLF